MAAEADSNNIIRFTYTGEENIPLEATHIFVDAAFIPADAFYEHPNIVELICSERVKKIEEYAFCCCPSLRRVIMPGVEIVETGAFIECRAFTDVECSKLEIIVSEAFSDCSSLRIINLPSVRIIGWSAFSHCTALMDVKFGSRLERIDGSVFYYCTSLERIAIPLTDGIFDEDDIFQDCDNFRHVDLVEGQEVVHATIAALHLEEWRNDMNEEIDSINKILPDARVGHYLECNDPGEKAVAIRTWIRSVLDKINHYQAEHQRILNEAAATLRLVLPQDLVTNNVLPFLQLPEEEE